MRVNVDVNMATEFWQNVFQNLLFSYIKKGFYSSYYFIAALLVRRKQKQKPCPFIIEKDLY